MGPPGEAMAMIESGQIAAVQMSRRSARRQGPNLEGLGRNPETLYQVFIMGIDLTPPSASTMLDLCMQPLCPFALGLHRIPFAAFHIRPSNLVCSSQDCIGPPSHFGGSFVMWLHASTPNGLQGVQTGPMLSGNPGPQLSQQLSSTDIVARAGMSCEEHCFSLGGGAQDMPE